MTPGWLTAFLDYPPHLSKAGTEFWMAVTGYALSSRRGDAEQFASLVPDRGDSFMRVQRIEEGTSKVHLDLHVPDVPAAAEQARNLGATTIHSDPTLAISRSPGGLTFCLVRHTGETERPPPTLWESHASLVDQISLDIPPAIYDDECRFWQQLTGWELRASGSAEFHYLERPPTMPLRMLLQRLDHGAPRVKAHLDLACDDRAAERSRHVGLGAHLVRETDYWTTLADPAGLPYCITYRDPRTGVG